MNLDQSRKWTRSDFFWAHVSIFLCIYGRQLLAVPLFILFVLVSWLFGLPIPFTSEWWTWPQAFRSQTC